jgi:gliding motility-associated-like protein
MMTKKFLIFLFVLGAIFQSNATHIVGGSMFYEHLGGSSYLVSIRLYKDCSPFSINFSTSLKVEIRNGDGTSPTPSFVRLPLQARDTLDPTVDTCAFNPGVCVELGVYSKIVNLPPQSGGYHLFYTDCCRNASVVNIASPLTHGEGLHTYIPDNNVYITNSSPVFTSYPPVYVCRGQDLNFDFSATDVDGDSLTYALITPYHGKNEYDAAYTGLLPTISSTGTAPDNITFNTISYLPNFSATNPLNAISGNGLTISSTGLLSGVPEAVGQFLVAVKVDEYRNGVKIGTIVRDFQYNVLDCPPLKDAAIGDIDVCSGTTVQMINESGAGANGFWWDFGTGNASDTSILAEPTFTFPSIGSYTLTLMAQKGTLCADTVYKNITLTTLSVTNVIPDTLCINELGTFTSNASTSFNDSISNISWEFGDNIVHSGATVEHSYTAPGDYTVLMIVGSGNGCLDTVTKMVHVNSPPEADFTPTLSCNTQTIEFAHQLPSSLVYWNFGTGTPADTSHLNSPTFTFPTYGTYPVTFVIQRGTACADTIIKNVNLNAVSAIFTVPDTICKDEVFNFQDSSTANSTSITQWEWQFGSFGTSNLQNPIQNFPNTGSFDIQLVVHTETGCSDTMTRQVIVVEKPTIQFQAVDLCSGLSVAFNNQSSGAISHYLWDFGTGQSTDTSQVFEPTFSFPAYGLYNVTLTGNPNSVCQATTSVQINVSNVQAAYSAPDTACMASVIPFTDQSVASNTLVQWHWNFGDLSTSVSQNNFHEFNQGGTYQVSLTVFASDGCSDTILHNIVILDQPTVNGGVDTAQCILAPDITLSASSQNSAAIIWSGNGGTIGPSVNADTITYTASNTELNMGSTFVVISTAGNSYCPIFHDTILIDFIDVPEITVMDDFSICENTQFIPISGTAVNSNQTVWTNLGSGTISNQNLLFTHFNPSTNDLANGSVTLILSSVNNYGCQNDSDTLTVTFVPQPSVNFELSDTICFLGELTLNSNISTGNGYWQTIGDGSFLPSDTGATTSFHPGIIDSELGYATIIFNSLDNFGCAPLTDTLQVTILPLLEASMGSGVSCVGSPSELFDATTYVEPIVNWTWFVEDSIYSAINPTHLFPDTGYFDVALVVTSETGCTDSIVTPVLVNSKPVPAFYSPEPCIYGAVFIDSSSADSSGIDNWLWYFGDGSSSSEQNTVHLFDSIGSYDITLTITSGLGCVDSITNNVNIFPPPVSQFTYFPNPAKVSDIVAFTSTAYSENAPIVTWSWLFGNGDSSNLVDPSTTYNFGGAYDAMLVVFDEVGCRDTSIKRLFITHGPKVPAAFSPNGDGVNDYLMILGTGFEAIDFTIYNNWGRVLYHTEDVNDKGWDGTYNGEPQPMGVYVYKAWVKNIYGQEVEISGDATIIR